MTTRPLTVREIQEKKKAQRAAELDKVRIRNTTRLQNVPIQIYGKNSKDAVNQISIQVGPGKSVDLPEYRLIPEQIANLRKRKMITATKVGPNGREFKDGDYRQFLPSMTKKNQKADPTKTGKSIDTKKKSSSKPKNKITKSQSAE